MVDALLQCMVHPNMPRQSIETLLHAFIPYDYVDHTHPDSVIAFCTTDAGEQLVGEAFGDEVAWVPYIRPGFTLAKQIGLLVRGNPNLKAVFMAKHGLVTWGQLGARMLPVDHRSDQQGRGIYRRALGRGRNRSAGLRSRRCRTLAGGSSRRRCCPRSGER